MNEERDNPLPLAPFDAFKAMNRKLVRAPKAEPEKKESEYKKRKKTSRRKPA
jgi:hypothetical protein